MPLSKLAIEALNEIEAHKIEQQKLKEEALAQWQNFQDTHPKQVVITTAKHSFFDKLDTGNVFDNMFQLVALILIIYIISIQILKYQIKLLNKLNIARNFMIIYFRKLYVLGFSFFHFNNIQKTGLMVFVFITFLLIVLHNPFGGHEYHMGRYLYHRRMVYGIGWQSSQPVLFLFSPVSRVVTFEIFNFFFFLIWIFLFKTNNKLKSNSLR